MPCYIIFVYLELLTAHHLHNLQSCLLLENCFLRVEVGLGAVCIDHNALMKMSWYVIIIIVILGTITGIVLNSTILSMMKQRSGK